MLCRRHNRERTISSNLYTAVQTLASTTVTVMAANIGIEFWESAKSDRKFRYPKKKAKEAGETAVVIGAIAAGGSLYGHWRAART